MNYVLSEKSANWLKSQMEASRRYNGKANPTRLVRRDDSMPINKTKFHFKLARNEDYPEKWDIGEGVVQIGGFTYWFDGASALETATSGKALICIKVTLTAGTSQAIAYGSGYVSQLLSDQADMRYYIFPLYLLEDNALILDYRPMPNAGCWEPAEQS